MKGRGNEVQVVERSLLLEVSRLLCRSWSDSESGFVWPRDNVNKERPSRRSNEVAAQQS